MKIGFLNRILREPDSQTGLRTVLSILTRKLENFKEKKSSENSQTLLILLRIFVSTLGVLVSSLRVLVSTLLT